MIFIKKVIDNLNKLIGISRTNDKINFIKELNDNNEKETLDVIKFLSDPSIITGISKAKLKKDVEIKEYNHLTISSIIDYLSDNNTGRDRDISVVKSFINNNSIEYHDILFSIFTKTLKLGISVKNLNKAIPNFIKSIEFMRAKNYLDRVELNKFDYEKIYQISLKIDGIRCALVKDKKEIIAYSRQGKIIKGLRDIENELLSPKYPCGVYDGELLAKGEFDTEEDRFQKTISIVNSKAENKIGLNFIVFDYIKTDDFLKGISLIPYKQRITSIFNLIDDNGIEILSLRKLPYYYVGFVSNNTLMSILDECDKAGKEGLMINDFNAIWEGKRTDSILKLKKNLIADVRVLEVVAGQGKHEGKLGALKVEFYYKEKMNTCLIGSGFTDEEREYFWKYPDEIIGKIIEVKYQKITKPETSECYALGFASYNHRIREDKTETNV